MRTMLKSARSSAAYTSCILDDGVPKKTGKVRDCGSKSAPRKRGSSKRPTCKCPNCCRGSALNAMTPCTKLPQKAEPTSRPVRSVRAGYDLSSMRADLLRGYADRQPRFPIVARSSGRPGQLKRSWTCRSKRARRMTRSRGLEVVRAGKQATVYHRV